MTRDQISTNSPDMADIAAQALGYKLKQIPVAAIAARRRMDRAVPSVTVVALPTQQDIDEPVTKEARASVAMATQMMAAILERHVGTPISARLAEPEARALLSVFVQTYRRVAQTQDGQ